MSKRFVCECGHTKTDHKTIKGVHKGNCDWYDCECQKFIHKTTEMRTNSTPMLESTVDHSQWDNKKTKRVLQMSDLKFDGTSRLRKGEKL